MTPDYAPKGIGRLIDEAIAVYRSEFRTLAVPAAYLLLPVSLLVGIAQGWYSQVALRTASAAASTSDPLALFSALSAPYALLGAAASLQGLVTLYFFSCVLGRASELLARRPIAPAEFLKTGASRFLALFAISFVVWALATVPLVIGFVLLFVPGLLLALTLAGYVAVTHCVAGVERAPLGSAFGRGLALIRGNVWRTVGFFLAIAVIVFSLESALTSIASLGPVLQTLTGATRVSPLPPFAWQVAGGVLQGVAETLTLPLMCVGWLLYYLDLRARREGMDLLARANALNAA